MTTLRVLAIAAAVVLLVNGASFSDRASAQQPGADQPAERSERALRAERRELTRHEQKIRRGKSVLRQIERDPKASSQVKQTVSELETLLSQRKALIQKLKQRHRDFVTQHQADIDELRDLVVRARAINLRLDAARRAVVNASRPELAEVTQLSNRAAALTEQLRGMYAEDRRSRLRP